MWFTLESTEGCESLHSSREPAAESSAERCSDGEQSVPSKLRSTREASSCRDKKTGSSTSSRSGMTLEHSTADRGAERSMSSVEVSHVRTSAAQAEGSVSSEENGVDYGASMRESFARYDRDTASWRTHQCSLFGGLESFSGTWPRSGMMRRGKCYPLAIVAPRMNGRECGSSDEMIKWPTPQGRDFKSGMASRVERSWQNLNDWVAKWPTPCRTDYKGAGKTGTFRDRLDYAVERGRTKSNVYPTPRTNGMCGGSGAWAQMGRLVSDGTMTDEERHQIGAGNGGKLNPDWVEWLMGWPIGWTASRPLATDKFRLWQQGRFAN